MRRPTELDRGRLVVVTVAIAQLAGCGLLGLAVTRWLGGPAGTALGVGVGLVAVPLTAALLVLALAVSTHAETLDPPPARPAGEPLDPPPARAELPAEPATQRDADDQARPARAQRSAARVVPARQVTPAGPTDRPDRSERLVLDDPLTSRRYHVVSLRERADAAGQQVRGDLARRGRHARGRQ